MPGATKIRCGNPLVWRLRLCQVMITLHWFWILAVPYLVLEKAYMHWRNWRNANELYPPLFLPGMDHCCFDIDVVCFCATAGKSVNSHVTERLGKELLKNYVQFIFFYVRQTEVIQSWWNSQHIPAPCTCAREESIGKTDKYIVFVWFFTF